MDEVDVVVVGAGLSGLAAADHLARAGASVRVLEARDRVGGRLLSERIGKTTFDLGGQWIGPHQRRVWALTRELGLETFDTFHHGDKLLWLEGTARRYTGTIPSLDPLSLVELQVVLMRLEAMQKRVDPRRPGEGPDAAALDAITLDGWLRANVRSAAVRELTEAAMRVVLGVDAREVSMLAVAFYARAGEGVHKLIEVEGGAQQTRFRDGAQRLAYGLAERLGDAVRPGRPVRAVTVRGERVHVRDDLGETRARRVILAVPPVLARRLEITPELPPARRRWIDRSPTGATTKHLLLYEHAFWRDQGLSGEAVCDDGPFAVTFDNSSADGSQAALLAFSVGQPARELGELPAAERQRRVRERLAGLFGARAAEPIAHLERDWAKEPWSRGCPVGLPATGVLSAHGESGLSAPHGPCHFAGTETAREHYGFLEGALEAAERAATEVARALE
ncbi:MAG: FAD-dependent oxidoreductase [Sandaracinaceae bacterium]|nr:FAD-dependent oxidoreductase [Sandaracinaceae bacterium]